MTRAYFKSHSKMKKLPTESEIMVFKKKYDLMDNKDWKKIKAFIYNENKK